MCFKEKELLFRALAFAIDTIVSTTIVIIMGDVFLTSPLYDNIYYVIISCMSLLLFRDIFGKSLGKFLLGLEVTNELDGKRARFSQRILKNITIPITMVEIIVIICNKDHKKIGDRLAKTQTIRKTGDG